MAIKFATRYAPPKSPVTVCDPEGDCARQEFEEECNIHNILKKFKQTGVLVDPTLQNLRKPMFEDVSAMPEYADYLDMVESAKESFGKLPPAIQEVFSGDAAMAAAWLSKASDKQIVDLWRKCGCDPKKQLVVDKPVDKPVEPVDKPVEKPVEKPEDPA